MKAHELQKRTTSECKTPVDLKQARTARHLVIVDYADEIKNEKMGLEYEFMQFEAETYNKILSVWNK